MNVNLSNTDNNDYVRGYKDGKIAGATAEHDRAQVLVDALELIEANSELPGIKSFATTALEQWKSGKEKEVGDE